MRNILSSLSRSVRHKYARHTAAAITVAVQTYPIRANKMRSIEIIRNQPGAINAGTAVMRFRPAREFRAGPTPFGGLGGRARPAAPTPELLDLLPPAPAAAAQF